MRVIILSLLILFNASAFAYTTCDMDGKNCKDSADVCDMDGKNCHHY